MRRRDRTSAPDANPKRSCISRAALVGAALVGVMVTDICLAALMQAAFAQPPRRSTRKSQPVPITHAAPDTTATLPAGKPPGDVLGEAKPAPVKPSAVVTQPYGEELPKPFDLPAAPRARMRSCGEKWQTIKLSGRAGSDTWREFATKCLAETARTQASP